MRKYTHKTVISSITRLKITYTFYNL